MITKEKKVRYISLRGDRKEMIINTYNFEFNARFICNYILKASRSLKLVGDGSYKMITVDITPDDTHRIDIRRCPLYPITLIGRGTTRI